MKRLIFLLLALLVAGSASAATKVQVMTDGVIDVDRLPTISFFQETDPSSPELGQIWWNNATNQLKVAGALGVYAFNSTSLVEWDTTPEAFSFTDVANATTSTVYTSDPITVSGINWPTPISVSGDASAKYSVNNATATAANGTVASGDEVRAVVTSSASAATAVNATVTIGGVSDAYSVTTAAASGDTYLVDEDFEGTGTPLQWSATSSANLDYTTSPLAGSQSVELPSSGETQGITYTLLEQFSGTAEISFMFRAAGLPGTTTRVFYLYSDSTECYSVRFSGSTTVIQGGSVSSPTASYAMNTDTVYYIWMDIDTVNKTMSYYINTSDEKPSTALKTVTGDQTPTSINKITLKGLSWTAGKTYYYDNVKMKIIE